ncbi:MAG TPA: hypothetical protein RMF84_16900, partial [Polyangiaceae bacterium LLY-WYZ-14_1]|nr:hypothetical protein [Polyangiaceae bacterium LLY-WYZ-14_1]
MGVRTRLGRAVAWVRSELDQQADRGRPVPPVLRDAVDLISVLIGGSEPSRHQVRDGGSGRGGEAPDAAPVDGGAEDAEEASFEAVPPNSEKS